MIYLVCSTEIVIREIFLPSEINYQRLFLRKTISILNKKSNNKLERNIKEAGWGQGWNQVMAHTKAEDHPSDLRELMANIFTQKFFHIKTISFFFKSYSIINFSDLYWLFLLRLKFAVHLFSEYIKRISPTLPKVVATVIIIFQSETLLNKCVSLLSIAKISESQLQCLIYEFFLQFAWSSGGIQPPYSQKR